MRALNLKGTRLLCILLGLVAFDDAALAQANGTFTGKIVDFQCGDNCYLTVVNDRGKKIDALCVATACRPWNKATEIPKRFIGKRVSVTVGRGVQIDGGGEPVEVMAAFREIKFLR
jgi:hypothetical protein